MSAKERRRASAWASYVRGGHPKGPVVASRGQAPTLPQTPHQAASQFVDKHVRFDPQGLPSLLPSAARGIAQAVASVRGEEAPSAARSVAEAPTVPTLTEPGHQYGTPGPTPKPSAPSKGPDVKGYKKELGRREKRATVPQYKSAKTGGAYAFDMAIGPKGQAVESRVPTKLDPAFKVAGTALEYAPFGLASAAGRTAAKAVVSATARQELKQQGVRQVARQSFPRIARATDAIRAAPEVARKAPATAAVMASTHEGRSVLAKQLARTAYHHKAVTTASLLVAAHQQGLAVPGAKQTDAFVRGTESALKNDPLGTVKTTARALPAAITAPVALGASGAQSLLSGSANPLKQEAQSQFEGAFFRKGPKQGILEKMLSGDEKAVEHAVRHEGGLAFLVPLPALTRTKGYQGLRSDVRGGAAALRREGNEIMREGGKRTRFRESPKGVERPVFSFAEKRKGGLDIVRHMQRGEQAYQLSAMEHGRKIVEAAGELKKSKGMKDAHIAAQTILDTGITGPEGVAFYRKHGPTSEEAAKDGVNFKAAIDFMEAHPGMWEDKRVKNLVDAMKLSSEGVPGQKIGVGQRARVSTKAAAIRRMLRSEGKPVPHELQDPMHQVPPEARQYTEAADREGAWAEVAAKEKRAGELVKQARTREAQAKVLEGRAKTKARADAKRFRKQADALGEEVSPLKDALDPFTRPEHSADTSGRTSWTKEMAQAHAKAVDEFSIPGVGKTYWTHHAVVREPGAGLGELSYPQPAGRRPHVRLPEEEGSLAGQDLVDRSLGGFLRGSVQMPRRRAGGLLGLQHVMEREMKYPIEVEGKPSLMVTRNQYVDATRVKNEDNPQGGQYDRKSMGFFPYNEMKNMLENPYTTEGQFAELLAEAERTDTSGRGNELGFLLPRHQIAEYRAKVQGDLSSLSKKMGKFSSGAVAAILGTNPAWALAQIPAEGIPLLLSHPSLAYKFPGIEKDLMKFTKRRPEESLYMEGTLSRSPASQAGALHQAGDISGGFGHYETPSVLAEEGQKLTRGRMARAFDEAIHLRPLRTFDVRRQGEFRTLAAVAQADKEFRSMTSKLKSLVKQESELAGKFRGKSRQEMFDWLVDTPEGRRALRDLSDKIDYTTGNWSAFTRLEREAAPFTIFYSFLRYALQWPLWLFPKSHPLTATVTYFLAQQNSNELEKILGQEPTPGFSYSYAFPVYTNDQGQRAVLPGGSRISPGQSTLQSAAFSKNPAAAVGALNPFLGAGVTAATGISPFGDKVSEPQGYAALNQIINLSPARYTAMDSEAIAHQFGLGGKETAPTEQGALSRTFQKLDPNKHMRSFAMPFIPQSAAKVKQYNRLVAALDIAKANNSAARSDVARDSHYTVAERKQKVAEMHAKSTAAGDVIDKIVKDVGEGPRNAKEYSQYKKIIYGEETTSAAATKPKAKTQQVAERTPLVSPFGSALASKVAPAELRAAALAKGAEPTTVAKAAVNGEKNLRAQEKQATKLNTNIARQIGDPALTPEKVGALAEAARITGVPASVLGGISKIEQNHGTINPEGDRGTRSTGDGTFLSAFNVMASAWGPGHELQKTANKLGVKHTLDPGNYGDGAIAAGIVLLNNNFKNDPEGAIGAYSNSGYGIQAGFEALNKAAPSVGVPQVKHPNARPFKGLLPVKGNFNLSQGMSPAKWSNNNGPHGDTVINKAVNPIVRAWATKFGVTVGEGYSPHGDHHSPEHLVTGTATDVYPQGDDWDKNGKAYKNFEKGIEVLTKAGLTVLYDGSIPGTTPYPNHGYGNHAHIVWLNADGSGGEALQKLTGMTNQQIANAESSVRAVGGGSYSSGGSSGGGASTSSTSGGSSGGSSFTPTDFSKLSAIQATTSSLPTVAEAPSVLEALKKLPEVTTTVKRKRLPV